MELKPGYKMTEVGVIPEEWDCTYMRDAAARSANAIVGGPFGSDLVSADYVPDGVPVVRGQNMSSSVVSGEFAYVSSKKASSLSANLARASDVIFTQRGTLGQVSIVPDNDGKFFVVSQSQMKVSLNRERFDPWFVLQYFSSIEGQKQIAASAIQTGVPHTNLGILRAYRFPAPSLAEQRTIAAALSDIDATIELLAVLLTKKRRIKQGAMQELLTGKRRLPGFEGEWESVMLGEFGTWRGGMTPSMQNPAYWAGTVPWVSSGDVKTIRLQTTANSITEHAVRGGAAMLPANSIFIVTRSGILRRFLPVAMNMVPMAINQDVKALVPSAHVHPDYILHSIIAHGDEILGRCLKSGTTVESIEFRWLREFVIPIPILGEQRAIASILSDMDTEIAALEEKLVKARRVKQAMMQELLTGRIRLVQGREVKAATAVVLAEA